MQKIFIIIFFNYFNHIYIVLVLLLQTLGKFIKASSEIHYLQRKLVEPAMYVSNMEVSHEEKGSPV